MAKKRDTFESKLAEIQTKLLSNPNADGWIRLIEILDKAGKDKRVMSSPGAREFLEIMRELASDALTAPSAEMALIKPLERIKAIDAANARHSKPGGSRDKANQIREIWATGKFTNRDTCAEQECAALGMSFSAARKALRNTPKPT